MPEKPEVMTVTNKLKPLIVGKKITGVNVYWDNIIATPTSKEFQEKIIGEIINNITTRGKFIVLELTNYSLLIHLRMEGKFTHRKKGEKIAKHEHVEFILDDNVSFRYHDVRKFGKMYLLKKEETYLVKPLNKLGVEFYDDDFTSKYLYTKIHHLNKPIKLILLDQSIISGIGNIYANEILYDSGIRPTRLASKVTKKECERIVESTKNILAKAVKAGGTTIKSFTSEEGVHGLFQNELLVHGKKDELCPKCNSVIKKEYLGGRGTYYCPKCQK